ncbi:13158_t:CDS:2 [Gigaspora margarita]|uniref:13158_t:CDS:1 n=1 Tax=Gigaspora margarita TaxID=4874 RepID=A0ABN7UMF1_GIGMA|nr:13158_t:CDS:2 [Gigaspora margarita]
MDNIQEILKAATEYLSLGNVKDAYFAYMNALEVASKELNNIKFVNNASKPVSYSSLFTISRTCLSYAEDIITKNQTAPTSTRKNPNLNIAIYPPTPQQAEHPLDPQNKAPPIPPKPNRRSARLSDGGSSQNSPKSDQSTSPIMKPPLPPKPARRPSTKRHSGDVEVSADSNDTNAVCDDIDDVDSSDSDDDDGYIRGRESFHRRSDPSLNTHTSLRRRSSSPSVPVSATKRRSTINGSITDSPTDEDSPYSSHLTSPATPASFYGSLSVPSSLPNLFERPKMINVIPEGAIDPNNLVSATTLSDDNSPSSPSSSQYVDHVPDIPSSPLLAQNTQLEQKIQTLEAKLAEYRAITKRREEGHTDDNDRPGSELSDEEIKEAIGKYSSTVASFKQSITRSRKLVFKASSDPDILEFAPHMIAYQLTLIESAIFLEIDPYALLSHSAKNPDPKITASTDFFNYLTRIIERSILLPSEASLRAQIINHWVKVAGKLHELHNFQTLKAVLSALGTTPIKRLKRTWACIPKKSMVKLETLNEMMSEARNYGKYRETIQRDGFLRKPTIPFLGTFIMDATYLLAAIKCSSNSSSIPLSNNAQSPIASRSVSSPTGIHDDPRVQEMLQTMHRYQNGPKYYSSPPSSYIKASTKHHFRTSSISAALHRTGANKYYNRNDDDDELIEEKQQLITHYLLTRVWIPQKSVDELSSLREPHKNSYSNNSRASNTTSWSGTPSSTVSNTNGAQRGSTGSTGGGSGTSTNTSNGVGRTSSNSGSGESRPHSEEVVDTVPIASTISKSDRAGPISDKETGSIKEKRNITEKVGSLGSFFFGSRNSLDKTRDEKEKEEKNKNGDADTDSLYDDCPEEISRIQSEQTSNKRASWRAMRVMFGGHESGDSLLKSPTAMIRSSSHSRSSSSGELNPKNHATTFIKAHGRTSSVNSKSITSRRSLEEPRSSAPPPLLPKPSTLMQRSSSASSANSMGSSASATNISGKRISTGNNTITLGGGDIEGFENIRMVLAKKVANEVAAGGVTLERNWQ